MPKARIAYGDKLFIVGNRGGKLFPASLDSQRTKKKRNFPSVRPKKVDDLWNEISELEKPLVKQAVAPVAKGKAENEVDDNKEEQAQDIDDSQYAKVPMDEDEDKLSKALARERAQQSSFLNRFLMGYGVVGEEAHKAEEKPSEAMETLNGNIEPIEATPNSSKEAASTKSTLEADRKQRKAKPKEQPKAQIVEAKENDRGKAKQPKAEPKAKVMERKPAVSWDVSSPWASLLEKASGAATWDVNEIENQFDKELEEQEEALKANDEYGNDVDTDIVPGEQIDEEEVDDEGEVLEAVSDDDNEEEDLSEDEVEDEDTSEEDEVDEEEPSMKDTRHAEAEVGEAGKCRNIEGEIEQVVEGDEEMEEDREEEEDEDTDDDDDENEFSEIHGDEEQHLNQEGNEREGKDEVEEEEGEEEAATDLEDSDVHMANSDEDIAVEDKSIVAAESEQTGYCQTNVWREGLSDLLTTTFTLGNTLGAEDVKVASAPVQAKATENTSSAAGDKEVQHMSIASTKRSARLRDLMNSKARLSFVRPSNTADGPPEQLWQSVRKRLTKDYKRQSRDALRKRQKRDI